ncbi:MAG: hypothetical protein DMG73_04620 [Acidobacteria bacterium]|nr:MAG: hypothetical protein DMG73_04620 [Acidobacteriota bacterium]
MPFISADDRCSGHGLRRHGIPVFPAGTCKLIAEADSDSAGGPNDFALRIDRFQLADCLGDIYRTDALLLQTHHFAEPTVRD